jgi:hypothetical protein
MSDLSTNTINNTYKSVLNVGTVPNSTLTTSLCVITDGMNNQSSLSISTANNGARVTGPFNVVGTISASNFDIPASSGAFQSILNSIYPINSVYFTSSNASFANFLGFTWVQISQGRFIAGIGTGTDKNGNTFTVGTSDTTGEYTHRLSAAEFQHYHGTGEFTSSGNDDIYHVYRDWSGNGNYTGRKLTGDSNSSSTSTINGTPYGTSTTNVLTGDSGLTITPHNNIPPYFGLYIWCRVA